MQLSRLYTAQLQRQHRYSYPSHICIPCPWGLDYLSGLLGTGLPTKPHPFFTPFSLRSDYSSQASDPTPWSVLRLAFIHCPYVYWAGPCLALDMPLKRTASLQSRNRDTDTETKCMNTEEGK